MEKNRNEIGTLIISPLLSIERLHQSPHDWSNVCPKSYGECTTPPPVSRARTPIYMPPQCWKSTFRRALYELGYFFIIIFSFFLFSNNRYRYNSLTSLTLLTPLFEFNLKIEFEIWIHKKIFIQIWASWTSAWLFSLPYIFKSICCWWFVWHSKKSFEIHLRFSFIIWIFF